jgi:hypothetical protein
MATRSRKPLSERLEKELEESTDHAKEELDLKSIVTSSALPQPSFTYRQGQFLAFIHLYCRLHRRGPAEIDMVKYFGRNSACRTQHGRKAGRTGARRKGNGCRSFDPRGHRRGGNPETGGNRGTALVTEYEVSRVAEVEHETSFPRTGRGEVKLVLDNQCPPSGPRLWRLANGEKRCQTWR